MKQMKLDSFDDFLNEKFFEENPGTLDDDWPDAYSDWLANQDVDDLVRWGQEYSDKRLELNKTIQNQA